jgi:hypothetical protein
MLVGAALQLRSPPLRDPHRLGRTLTFLPGPAELCKPADNLPDLLGMRAVSVLRLPAS